MSLHTLPLFYRDVAHEIAWLAEHAGAEVADRWAERLAETIRFIQENPELSRVRTDLDFPGIRARRMMHFVRWLVFYSFAARSVTLHRVVGGSMNLLALRLA